ncbi:hypothetical protein [Bartonella sp. AP58NXGY]|uniref:hypothetical protein n=2 Tax=unclassified Bartonella TaxID=2645622 RepID=UPI0035D0CC1B
MILHKETLRIEITFLPFKGGYKLTYKKEEKGFGEEPLMSQFVLHFIRFRFESLSLNSSKKEKRFLKNKKFLHGMHQYKCVWLLMDFYAEVSYRREQYYLDNMLSLIGNLLC